jgi:hypothetical protein
MKVSPSLITPYFGRICPEDEEISTREFSVPSFSLSQPRPKLLIAHDIAANKGLFSCLHKRFHAGQKLVRNPG